MLRRTLVTLGICGLLLPEMALAQTTGDKIDLYFGDWHASPPHVIRGALEERDILTRGDALNPTQKGAVLRYVTSYTHAILAPQTAADSIRLKGEQEIYFVASGTGTVMAGGETADLYRNIAVLMPANLEFSIRNSGTQPLEIYVIREPIPDGFRPNAKMLVRDENKLAIASSDGFWAHLVKPLFVTQDGLGTLESVLTVTLDPLTIGKPHPVPGEDTDEIEEVWTALDGTSVAFIGNSLRRQPPGVAYLHAPDNKTPHTNLNPSEDTQDKFLYFARYRAHEPRK